MLAATAFGSGARIAQNTPTMAQPLSSGKVSRNHRNVDAAKPTTSSRPRQAGGAQRGLGIGAATESYTTVKPCRQ